MLGLRKRKETKTLILSFLFLDPWARATSRDSSPPSFVAVTFISRAFIVVVVRFGHGVTVVAYLHRRPCITVKPWL
jgi:hypothetical protein